MKAASLLALSALVLLTFTVGGCATGPNYHAKLTGDQVVPPVKTQATGELALHVNPDATEMKYDLTVHNLHNVRAAHIHLGKSGANGPEVLPLYTLPKTGQKEARVEGKLASGTLTSKDLMGELQGRSLQALIDEIRAGRAYVQVHTEQNPDGEIRGQVE